MTNIRSLVAYPLPRYHSPLCSRDCRFTYRHGIFDWGTPVVFEPLSDLFVQHGPFFLTNSLKSN